MKESLRRGETTFAKPEGIDRKYLHIKDLKHAIFTRNPNKTEAGISPEPKGTVRFESKRSEGSGEKNPYDEIVNQKVVRHQDQPKFTFETQELYEQADYLCQRIPHWKTERENPIYNYIPKSMRNWQKNDFNDDNKPSEKEQRLGALTTRNKSQLMLAATLSLNKRTVSPQTRIR
jgi:hypothetical protein